MPLFDDPPIPQKFAVLKKILAKSDLRLVDEESVHQQPTHSCVRERLAEAQAHAKYIHASIEKADSGLRYRMSREQELKQSIADLEAKCAH